MAGSGLACTGGRSRSWCGSCAEKKTPKPDPCAGLSVDVETDHARERYEQLRHHYLQGSDDEAGPAGERFARLGLVGLFEPDLPRRYVVQIHAAPVRGWGRCDPRDTALREVVRLLVAPEGSSLGLHELPHR